MTDAAESWGEPRRQEIVDPSADEPIDQRGRARC
jgi:hypothetical protein